MEHNYFVKISFLIAILLILATKSYAFSTVGYIVTLDSDTIFGQIHLSKFNQVSGGLILNGIEEESFHSRVVFEANGEKKSHTYFPEMILGFGFIYNTTVYIYERVQTNMKSIFESEKHQYRFMRLLYNGDYGISRKDLRLIQNPGLQSNPEKYLKFTSYLYHLNRLDQKQSVKNDTIID